MTGKVAMKLAALLNGSGSFLRSIRLMIRWRGRKVNRNRPASAITNFLERDEKRILFIGYEMFTDIAFVSGIGAVKLILLNNIINKHFALF
jgi:hypothetical protein